MSHDAQRGTGSTARGGRPWARAVAVLVVVGLAVLATGCSDDGGDEAATAVTEATATHRVTVIGPDEAMGLIDDPERQDLTIVDVRTRAEYVDGHVPEAVNIDLQSGSFADEIAELDPARTYVVYCQSGNRSAQAAQIMAEAGFSDVYDMGGIADWQAAGGEVVAGG